MQPAQSLFFPDRQDAEKYRIEVARKPAANTRFVIWFTPRSGSSWLTDIASQTNRLSRPGECFNPGFVPVMAEKMNAATIDQYIEILLRRRNTHDVFGCQLTLYHFNVCFPDPSVYMTWFGQAPCFWLIREDIVLQAISLARKQQTKIGHSTAADAATLARTDGDFTYDAKQIQHWLKHLTQAETGSERFFKRHGLSPLRLSYERLIVLPPATVVNVMARHIGIPPIDAGGLESGHRKIGTDLNADYAARFREEHPRLIARIDRERAPMLARLAQDPGGTLPAAYGGA